MAEEELLNVTGSLIPAAEMLSLFLSFLYAAGQENAFPLLVLHSKKEKIKKKETEGGRRDVSCNLKRPCPVFRCKAGVGEIFRV